MRGLVQGIDPSQAWLVQTGSVTDNTPTIIGNGVGPKPDTICFVEALVVMRDGTATTRAEFILSGRFARVATAAPVADGATTVTSSGSDSGAAPSGWDADLVIDGNRVKVEITGPDAIETLVAIQIRKRFETVLDSVPWSPLALPNLKFWLRADLGVTQSGTVSAWADQSGNGNDFAQATAGKRPVFTASDSSANNQPTMTFAIADNTCLLGPTIDASGWAGMTQVAITKFSSGGVYAMFISHTAGDELRTVAADPYLQLATNGVNDCTGSVDRSGAWGVAMGRHKASDTTANVSWNTTTDATTSSAGPLISSQFAIGDRSIGGDPINMVLAEVIVVARSISDSERAQIHAYAAARYGL